jgi:hypothetical protein
MRTVARSVDPPCSTEIVYAPGELGFPSHALFVNWIVTRPGPITSQRTPPGRLAVAVGSSLPPSRKRQMRRLS